MSAEEGSAVEEHSLEGDRLKIDLLSNERTGVVYLSRIPTKMNVKILRSFLSEIGQVGRVYLQLDEKSERKKKAIASKKGLKKAPSGRWTFSEGWVEFLDKADAKLCAKMLNNTEVGGKRHNPWYGELWNIKYLSKFKWTHLNERDAYERMARKQRLRVEVGQAKREAAAYVRRLELAQRRKRRKIRDRPFQAGAVKGTAAKKSEEKPSQRTTPNLSSDPTFLSSIFTGGIGS